MCPSKLDAYQSKRDPKRTPEPMGRPKAKKGPSRGRRAPSFVVQEHHARALHWDFRLERDGVLVSWALPKGVPLDPQRNHLAVAVEDHPLEYGEFAGAIPEGEYGAGTVTIWDSGTYNTEKWSEREVMVVLHGERVSGRYVLFRTDGKTWMIHRMDPAPEDWEPVPELIRPMLCRPAEEPPKTARGWTTEFKWDGVRAVVYVDGGRVRIVSRNDLDITGAYPELHALGRALGSRPAVLDGEIVAFDEDNRPSFGLLQQRMHVAEAAARRLARRIPVSYLAFDVLHLDGRSTIGLPYAERRSLLESLDLAGEHWATPATYRRAPQAVMDVAVASGLEGIVSKRTNSRYLPGRRSDDWVKVRAYRAQEVVVGGYTPGQGSRSGTVGALVVGIPGPDGLVYTGKVGTGFSEAHLKELSSLLGRLERKTSPFAGELPRAQVAGAHWVRPTLVGEVRFSGWTAQGRLRQPAWRGLRPDKSPSDVVVEP